MTFRDVRVERSARISAPPEVVYPLIEDFHRWAEWSPWEGLDPGMRTSHAGSHDGERWWITSWIFDSERPDNPIPQPYLPGVP